MPREVPQAAALPIRTGRVFLITSRSGKRWVIPKGLIDPGHTPREAAAAEAWEEAGLTGELSAEPVGHYRYAKYGAPHAVAVYLLTVRDEAADWPERGERRREWVTPAEAARRVDEPELKALLLSLEAVPA
jgi:8-oxo-dGTP pyrophosphatase MutT (NUDIX family)